MNLLSPLPDARAAEQVATLLTRPGLRVERIVSLGQTSPRVFWYDQAEGEWGAGARRRRKHRQSYLDEFVFRFNRRRTRHAAFRSLLGIYKMLISPEAKHKPLVRNRFTTVVSETTLADSRGAPAGWLLERQVSDLGIPRRY